MRQILHKSTANSLDNVLNMNNIDISEMCNNSWYDSISKERFKLQWYSTFKNNLEDYLHEINNFQHGQALAKFRISAHCLGIERGRYCRPLVPCEKKGVNFHKIFVMMNVIS